MSKQVTLTIDGKQATVPDGTYVADAAKMVGIDIPVFCHHPKLEPVGMCRMCLVEIGRPVRDRTKRVRKKTQRPLAQRLQPTASRGPTTPSGRLRR